MKIVVLGAGAIGSIVAAHLARAGEDVALIARGDRATFLRQNGITITELTEFNVSCPIVTHPSELSGADTLIVAVKSHDVVAALSSVAEMPFTSVLSVQNGVLGNEQLGEVFGNGRTLGATASFSGEVLPNGHVRFTVNGGFYIGELPEGLSTRVQDLAMTLQNTGINTEAVSNIQTLQWSKFVIWVPLTAVALLTRLPTYKFLLGDDTALVCARIMREVAAIAGCRDIPIKDSAGVPSEAVVNGSEEAGVSALNGFGKILEANAPNHRMSALQDLENGRRLEIDATLGYAVEEAHQLGLATPTLEMSYGLLSGVNRSL